MSPRPFLPRPNRLASRARPGVAGLALAAAVLSAPFAEFADAQTVIITSTPASGSTYGAGEAITTQINGLTGIQAGNTSLATMTLDVGGVERQAASTSSLSAGMTEVNFSYTVTVDDRDTDGITIPANSIDTGGATWLALGGLVVNRSHAALRNQAGHRVDGYRGTPGVIGVALNSPDVGDTFERGEVIEATVTFTQAVDVTGTPQLALTIGTARQANYFSGTGSRRLVFRYTVVQADAETNGISIAAAALTLNGGTIQVAGGSTNATLGLGSRSIRDSADHKVDGSTLTAPAVSGASITSRPRDRGSYETGERIVVRVTFDRVVDADGTPQLALTIGRETRQADFSAVTGTTLSFSYVVASDDVDENGISVAADALTLNGGTIRDVRDASVAASLDLGMNAIRDASGHTVNSGVGGAGGPPAPEPPAGVETTSDGDGSVTISWAHPGDPDIATWEYLLQQAGRTVGDWRTVPGSDADTTSFTVDLATGEARAVNDAEPPVEWTILLRARDRNGNAGGIARTTVTAAGTPVPAVPAAWLGVQAVLLLCCCRKRGRMLRRRPPIGGRGRRAG